MAEEDWSAVRKEVEAASEAAPIGTFKNFEDEICSDSDEDENTVFQDMQLFLHAIGEPQLVEQFLKNRVTLGQLLEFNEQDLINCGVELVGDRKKILENIGQMHCEKWQPSSLHELTSKSLLSSPGIYIALNDINKHTEYIGVTFKYLKRRLEENPKILELGKDYVGMVKVLEEIEDLLKTSKTTFAQLRSLQKEVSKYSKDPTKKPANHIDTNYIERAKRRKRLVPTLIIAIAICASVKISCVLLRA